MGKQQLRKLAATLHHARPGVTARPVLLITLTAVWGLSIALCVFFLLGSSKVLHTNSLSVGAGDVSWLDSLPQRLRGLGQHNTAARPYACDAAAQPSPDDIQQRFAQHWGHRCVPFRQACYDQGNFVVYGKQHHPWHNGKAPMSALKLGNNHLEFKDFGDIIGISQYPEIIFRPANRDEEAADLRSPVFSNCARPVVLYLNHLYMFGDFWTRTMPALMNALGAGAWDTDYSIVIATGGQSLEPWQKLLLQPFSKHPIITLSDASSRTVAHITLSTSAGGSSSNSSSNGSPSNRRLLLSLVNQQQQQQQQRWQQQQQWSYNQAQQQQQQEEQQRQQFPAKVEKPFIEIEQRTQPWKHGQQHWLSYKQQHLLSMSSENTGQQLLLQQHFAPLVPTPPPVTHYGRCFESLTVCSIQNPKVFGQRPERETWRGAQYVKSYWEQQYGAKYKRLLPQYERMQEAGALKVVFAVRGGSAVRNLLNQQELLDWCNNWAPTAAAPGSAHSSSGTSSTSYTHTVCVAHKFGQHGKVHGGSGHLTAAAAGMAQESSSSSNSATNSSSGSRGSGFLSMVRNWAGDVSGTIVGFLSGHRGRALLTDHSSMRTRDTTLHQPAAATGAAADLTAADVSLRTQSRYLRAEQQVPAVPAGQMQSNESGDKFDHPADLPEDPQLDPRALLTDFALLDAADVVVGLHGAQLYNALFMPAHKALIEVRPMTFTGGWPEMYFKEPLVASDNMDSIFWFGIDTVKPTNSQPGKWEAEGTGCCHERDRHTRIEPAALEYLFKRIVWAEEDPARYKQLDVAKETHITDTLQTAAQYYKKHAAPQVPHKAEKDQQDTSQEEQHSRAQDIGQVDDGYLDIEEPLGQNAASTTTYSNGAAGTDEGQGDVASGEAGQPQQDREETAGASEASTSSEVTENSEQQQQQKHGTNANKQEQTNGDVVDSPKQVAQLTPEQLAVAEQYEYELQADEDLLAWEAKQLGPLQQQPHVASWQDIADDYARQPL